jgi:hypothetical protein
VVCVTTLDTRPSQFGIGLTVLFGLIAMLATFVIPLSLVPGLFGLLFLVGGTARERASLVTIGAGGLVIAILIAGLAGAGPVPLLIATAATVLAWDAGTQAIDLGTMLGRKADTSRPLLVHSAASTAIAATVSGLGYAIYHIVSGGQPVTALVLLLFGALVLIAMFRG